MWPEEFFLMSRPGTLCVYTLILAGVAHLLSEVDWGI